MAVAESKKINIVERLGETFHRYPAALRSAVEILGASSFAGKSTLAVIENLNLIGEGYRRVLSELVKLPADQEIGYVVSALHRAMILFAQEDCRAPTREEVLVGLFRGAISKGLASYEKALTGMIPDGPRPKLYTADLNIKDREKKTGGDIAFILDVVDVGRGRLVIPICLQAKRAAPSDGATVDIRRVNKSDREGRHQLDALRTFASEVDANCAYLFFNNHRDFMLYDPTLPLVKSLDDVLKSASQLDVDLSSDVVDFGNYILHLASGAKNAASDIWGLSAFISKVAEGNTSHLILITSDPRAWDYTLEMMGDHRARYELSGSHKPVQISVDFEVKFRMSNSFSQSETQNVPTVANRPALARGRK